MEPQIADFAAPTDLVSTTDLHSIPADFGGSHEPIMGGSHGPTIDITALKAHQDRQTFKEKKASEAGLWREPIPGLVFTTDSGEPILTTTALHEFQKKLGPMGLLYASDGKKRRCYDLRHTAITWLLRRGMSLHEVARLAGHASIVMTSDVYGDLLEEGKQAAADTMDAMLAASK